MAQERWKVSYRIMKVNKQEHIKAPDLIKEDRINMPKECQRAAEQLADWGDFLTVEVRAKSLDSSETFRYTFQSDDGTREDWVSGRQ